MARRKRKSSAVIAIVLVIILIAVFVGGWYLYTYQRPIFDEIYNTILGKKDNETPGEPDKPPVIVDGDLSIHFLELGNNYTGDCIYIKAGDTDVLVDAGSRAGSVDTIQTYLKDYVKDDILEYVVVTHADQDHIAGFGASKSIFDLYECKTIIQFARSNKEKDPTKTYNSYKAKRDAEVAAGAVCYTALECYRETNGAKKTYQLSDDVTMNILYQEFYENSSSDENNYSVCFLLTHGDRNFLFTGDLEKKGEESLVANNKLPEVELFKAGHHGSPTSSNDILLSVIKPKIVCVCCCAGSVEYTQNLENTFPSQAFINRVAVYTDKVYVTTMVKIKSVYNEKKEQYEYKDDPPRELLNGNIVVSSGKEGINVNCTNNNTVLKDTEWFKNNRTLPDAWKAAA